MLLDHVLGLVQRTGEHELPVQGKGFALERHDIQLCRVVDQRELALWTKHFDQLGEVGVGMGQADHMIDRVQLERFQLMGDRFGVIDDMMRPQLLDPGLGFRP
ncbi:hypothetical protein D3C76_1481600 [compost metagenome]